jgi:hypothetical protein
VLSVAASSPLLVFKNCLQEQLWHMQKTIFNKTFRDYLGLFCFRYIDIIDLNSKGAHVTKILEPNNQ